MSKKRLSLEDFVGLYSIARSGSKENSSKYDIRFPSEQEFAGIHSWKENSAEDGQGLTLGQSD